MSHLLSLSELHAEAPGVLEVVFGPDGDFEGAPNWHPPLWDGAWAHHFGAVPDPIDGLALDLRVPSVAARLAGLCARALRPRIGGTTPWNIEESDGGVWILCPARRHGLMWFWESNGMGRADAPTVRLPDDCDREGFLRALTLALAPNIRDLARRES